MRLSGHEINSQLRQKLAMPMGRHLYVVLGTYDRIERYERVAFREARSPDDKPLGPALNINHSLLQRFGDEELKWLVRNEAGMQETVKKQLADELDALIADKLTETSFLAGQEPRTLVCLRHGTELLSHPGGQPEARSCAVTWGEGRWPHHVNSFLVDQNFNEHIVDGLTRRDATEELLIAAHCLTPDECKDIVEYFPM
jgi:hypothetical protein